MWAGQPGFVSHRVGGGAGRGTLEGLRGEPQTERCGPVQRETAPHMHLGVGRPEEGLFFPLPPTLERELSKGRLGSFQSLFIM